MTRFRSIAAAVFVSLSSASIAPAALIYESAATGPTLQTGGSGTLVDHTAFTAVNFQVVVPTTTGSIGAHLTAFGSSTNPVFGAIVALAGPLDVPDSANLSTPDVLGFTLINPPDPSDNRAGNLRLTLSPGWYALVFGSGQFGATGAAGALSNNTPNGFSQIYVIRQSDGAILPQAGGPRLFIDSTPVPTFQMIADTTTLIPGTASTFTSFSQPSIRDGAVAFRAVGPAGNTANGIYTNAGGPLRTVANLGTLIPSGTGTFTSVGTQVSLSQGVVAFRGGRAVGGGVQDGFYTDTIGTLARRVDRNTPFPGGTGNFTSLGINHSFDQGQLAFYAGGSGTQRGLFRHDGTTLHTIARDGTAVPGEAFSFTDFLAQYVGIDSGKNLFRGVNGSNYIGLFTDLTGPLTKIHDINTPMPGESVNFFFTASPHLRNGKMAFVAADALTNPTVSCVYSNVSGTLEPIACMGDPVPSIGGTFPALLDTAFNGREVAFRSVNDSNVPAIFTNIGGELMKTIARNDVLDNKIVNTPSISIEAIDGNSIAFLTTFTNGTSGIYVATYPDLDVPGDIDADGDLDGGDITAFIAVLTGAPLDPDHIPRCDMNGDAIADGRDVKEFTSAHVN